MLARPPGMPVGRSFSIRARRAVALLGATALAGAMAAAVGAAPAGGATLTANVTVNATAGLGTIPSDAIGLGAAVYDGYMNNADIPGLLKAAGIDALRYPGGSYSDIYNWQTGVAQGGYTAPNTNFASFMTTAKATGAEPVITVNYGTGSTSLGAAWVQNAVANGDHVK